MLIILGNEEILIDDDCFDLFKSRRWSFQQFGSKKYLAAKTRRDGKSITLFFHKEVLPCSEGLQVDHKSCDTRDNRRSNLRFATRTQNNRNRIKKDKKSTSRFKGVGISRGKWRARIKVDSRNIYLGRFETEEHAAYAYDMASLKFHGDFGNRNFLPLA